ncbi:hypothetical protein [Mariniblastus fucicola]|uniref:Uncharacterized protein n=1 Tax=Mariniblastus fucicola TaxID=980251 RepID=A0A5B9PC23_9BACT|nr:hypothetical protein [Mariniblastus fucicola]QEG22600.1 hypothetical protein MFFC18_24830 [Mariniblastus fucicola]
MNDDFPNDISTSCLITVNGDPLSANFETADDKDWFRFDVEPYQVYQIQTADYRFATGIYDQQGDLL